MNHAPCLRAAAGAALLLASFPASAQAAEEEERDPPRKTRIVLGPQLTPSYPGADTVSLGPLVEVSRTDADSTFEFEAPDESFGFALLKRGGFAVGTAVGFQGKRTSADVGGVLPEVGFTLELGGYAQVELTPAFRVRAELRQGLGGHRGLTGSLSGDYVVRDADKWLVSIGPRLTFSDARHQRAYLGVSPVDAAAAGLAPFDPDAGLQAVGATAGFIRELSPRWSLYGYARYDRLVGDAERSPVVRAFGSPNQYSGGIALGYVFGGR